jgi:GntR family transcriptional regulator/MocR family aminotransferase
MRARYDERRRALITALESELGPWLVAMPSSYGMHLAALSTGPAPLDQITRELARHQIHVHDLSRYFLGPPTQSGLVFGFGVLEPAEIQKGIAALRRALSGAG